MLVSVFLSMSILDLARLFPSMLGVDSRIYLRAAAYYRIGASPWDAFVSDPTGLQYHFAALPPAVQLYVPLTVVPERLAIWLSLWATGLAAVYLIHKLRLPYWWLLFPPLVEGIFTANPQVLLLALLVSGYSFVASLAPMLKIYAFAPLVGERRWAALAGAAVLLAASWVLGPSLWADYFTRFGDIAVRNMLEARGGYSAFSAGIPVLLVTAVALLVLAILDLRSAGWVVAPALVPGSQFHMSTLVMPLAASGAPALLIIAFAIPVHGLPAIAAIGFACWRLYGWSDRRRLSSVLGASEEAPPARR